MVMFKKGDTLVEVMLAIGIFSMIAIAITAVMTSGSSGAQTALETTLAREEIDTQAEAIRFIQASYAINKNSADKTYAKLWDTIKSQAIDLSGKPKDAKEQILQYTPSTCGEALSQAGDNAFIINPRALSTFSSDGAQTAIYTKKNDPNVFQETQIYPRLVFGDSTSENEGNNLLINSGDRLYRTEGIYVIAVKDDGTTDIIDAAGDVKDSGFYDFFIRSCWYGANDDQPTTISTVIRLYDPDAITKAGLVKVDIEGIDTSLEPPGGTRIVKGDTEFPVHKEGSKVTLPTVEAREGWDFVWRVIASSGDGARPADYTFDSGAAITNDTPGIVNYTVRGEWTHIHYKVKYVTGPNTYPEGYDTSGITPVTIPELNCYYDNRDDAGNVVNCILDNNINPSTNRKKLTASGYRVIGWCSTPPTRDGNGSCDANRKFNLGANINDDTNHNVFRNHFNQDHEMTLYPIWVFNNETITIKTEWTSDCSEGRPRPYGCDYDSYMKLQDPNGSGYLNASWSTGSNDSRVRVTVNGETYQLVVGQGDGRGSINGRYYEGFEIKTLGGKNYYYSITNYSNPPGVVGDDITVTISGPYTGTYTFRSDHLPSSSCKYWNVFAYIDGEVYERNTCTNSTEIWAP